MPLDEHEQKIFGEIERQFYEEDPDLVEAVRKIERSARFGMRFPVLGIILGAALVVVTFTFNSVVALVGFGIMVVSATAFVSAVRAR